MHKSNTQILRSVTNASSINELRELSRNCTNTTRFTALLDSITGQLSCLSVDAAIAAVLCSKGDCDYFGALDEHTAVPGVDRFPFAYAWLNYRDIVVRLITSTVCDAVEMEDYNAEIKAASLLLRLFEVCVADADAVALIARTLLTGGETSGDRYDLVDSGIKSILMRSEKMAIG